MSLALHYWMGGAHHCSGPPVSEMTYTVSSGTLNPSIPDAVLWSRDHGLETLVHSSSFCPGLGLEIWSPRSRSSSQDSMLDAYACSTITVICIAPLSECSVTNWNWYSQCCDLDAMVSRLDGTRIQFVQVSVLVSGPEVQVSVLVSRPENPGLGLGLGTLKGLDNNTGQMVTPLLNCTWHRPSTALPTQ